MPNQILTASVIAKEALVMLENQLGVLGTIYRAHEDEFSSTVNGYKKGATISIRRPADFTLRTGAVLTPQDAIEGSVPLTVDQQVGVDFRFSSTDLTLSINQLSERFIKPAMSTIVNGIVADCFAQFYPAVYNWVGTPGTLVNSFASFNRAPERLNEMATPMDDRFGALSPSDHSALAGNLTTTFIAGDNKEAYRKGALPPIGGVDINMTQVVPTHTNGAAAGTPIVQGAGQSTSYENVRNTWSQTLNTQGWTASSSITAGTVFTIANVFMVNPKTKQSTGILQQFVVRSATTSNATTTSNTPLTISPAIITTGPHQTVNAAPAASAAITVVGAANGAWRQNLVYHKNAFGLAVVPMELPPGAYGASRESYKGLSVRVIPVYDGTNDLQAWRLDLLYGRTCLDPRLATRLSG